MIAALALLLTSCAFQEREGQPTPEASAQSRFALGAHGRVSLPISSMERDINILTQNPNALLGTHKWGDFFPMGIGGALQAELVWETPGPEPGEVQSAVGGYLAIGFDHYQGRKVDDPFGGFIDPDALDILTIQFGPKFVYGLGGGFFLDAHVGLGPVHYSKVDADMSSVGLQQIHGEFIADSWAFGTEIGGHVGLRAGSAAFVLGIDCRILTSPDGGDDVQLSANILIEFVVDFGVELRF